MREKLLTKANSLILTPNRRLANFFRTKYNLQQQAKGKASWEELAIQPLNSWLEQLWQQSLLISDLVKLGVKQVVEAQPNLAPKTEKRLTPKLLTTIEQQLVWESIIIETELGQRLLNIKVTAEHAIKAWNILEQWNIPLAELEREINVGSDSEAFIAWAKLYQAKCELSGWLDFPMMVNELIKLLTLPIARQRMQLPDTCCFLSFQETTPQQNRLIICLQQAGVEVVTENLLADDWTKIELKQVAGFVDVAKVSALAVEKPEDEYLLAAKWAKFHWQQDKNCNIGIVVPELENCRKEIEQAFAAVFAEQVYNISAPKAMAKYKMIDIALLILQLSIAEVVEIDDFSQLLRSSFLAGSSELEARARLDVELHKLQEAKFSWQTLTEFLVVSKFSKAQPIAEDAQLQPGETCRGFMHCYTTWQQLLPQLTGKHIAQYWAVKIEELLHCWGWPGDSNLGINEQHLHTCWTLLLQDYLQLSEILAEHNFAKAVNILFKLATNTPFLPETGEASVQVLGVLEAAGIPFAKSWLLGMNRDVWPPEPQPNPFIPAKFQVEHDLPRSSPQRELKVAKQLSALLLSSCRQQVIVSYALHANESGTEISPLFATLKTKDLQQLLKNIDSDTLLPDSEQENKKLFSLEEIVDAKAPNYQDLAKLVPGGSKVLKLQSNCPFWAYAEVRLGAVAIKKSSIGLTASERGILLHEVLAKFWQQLNIKKISLLKFSLAEQEQLLYKLITASLAKFKRKRVQTMTANYLAMETKRLQQLLTKWLELERGRNSFTVYQIETTRLVKVGPLHFKLRLDRIDQLATGEFLIIDYKTSKPKVSDWFGIRPLDPQLPLYAIALAANSEVDSRIANAVESKSLVDIDQANIELAQNPLVKLEQADIAFAIIRPELVELQDYESTKNPQKEDSWQKQVAVWQKNLTNLAEEFAQGYAAVKPAKGQVTCQYCELKALCRICMD